MPSVPGSAMVHAIITPTCRMNRGVHGAFDEAISRAQKAYTDMLDSQFCDPEVHMHVILSAETKRQRDKASPERQQSYRDVCIAMAAFCARLQSLEELEQWNRDEAKELLRRFQAVENQR